MPNDVVHAESTNTFKSRLDKFWSNQEIIYDYRAIRAEIQGTGSRSVFYQKLFRSTVLQFLSISIEEAGKEAPRLRSYYSSMSTSKRAHYATVGDPQKVRICDVITRHLIFCTFAESNSIIVLKQL